MNSLIPFYDKKPELLTTEEFIQIINSHYVRYISDDAPQLSKCDNDGVQISNNDETAFLTELSKLVEEVTVYEDDDWDNIAVIKFKDKLYKSQSSWISYGDYIFSNWKVAERKEKIVYYYE